MKWRIEWAPLVMNSGIFIYYVCQELRGNDSVGRMLYWFGAIILTAGLLKMRG
jgi:hypothetical protein